MRKRLVMAAAVCGVLFAGCGHDIIEENEPKSGDISEKPTVEVTDDISEETEAPEAPDEEATEDDTEETVMTEEDFDIPEGAAYKYIKSMDALGKHYIVEIGYNDDKGNPLLRLSTLLNNDDSVSAASYFENEYDENGWLVKTVQRFAYADGEIVDKLDEADTETVLEYYDNGEIKRVNDGHFDIAFKYDYDEQGRKSAVYEYWDGSDELFSTTYYEYDENGDAVRHTIKYEGKKSRLDSVTECEYDEKHRVIREEMVITGNGGSSPYITTYEYTDLK